MTDTPRTRHLKLDWQQPLRLDYDAQDWDAVLDYIEKHHVLRSLLLEAAAVLKHEFPDSRLELEVASDIESGDGETLFIYIHTTRDVEDAMNRLRQVDDAWFLAAGRRSGHVFNVNLRFA